jgi:GNAT superfamily N-acetyltransferase
MMACMSQNAEGPVSDMPGVRRLGEGDWRAWRSVRLAALADSPAAFGSAAEDARVIPEEGWREMLRGAAIFVAATGDGAAGVVAGLYRDSDRDRGLGAMWVAPQWRGLGVAGMLVAAVLAWSRSEGAATVGLWVPGDDARARRFYERQGFRMTGRGRPFPGDPARVVSEMSLAVPAGAG